MSVQVRAIRRGFYDNQLRREEDVFTLERAEDFNPKWMVRVWNQAERRQSPKEYIRNACASVSGISVARVLTQPADDGPAVLHDFDPYASTNEGD